MFSAHSYKDCIPGLQEMGATLSPGAVPVGNTAAAVLWLGHLRDTEHGSLAALHFKLPGGQQTEFSGQC